jgi:spermidine/putrescine transport system permease protein
VAAEPKTSRERFALGVLLSPTLFWLIVFFTVPLFVILIYGFLDRGTYGGIVWKFQLENYIRFADPLYLGIFWRSFVIALFTTLICLLMGYPMAYWMATRSPKTRNTLLLLMMLPFWTNFVIRTYAWRFIIAREGILNNTLLGIGIINEPLNILFTDNAVILGLVYGWVVAMVLPCYASLVGLDYSLLEAAQDLYANRIRTFLRVTLPLTLPGIVSGSILVFVPSFGAFVTPDLLGGGKADMIGNLIQQQFGSAADWPFGAAISTILMVAMLAGTLIYFRSLRNEPGQEA